MTRDYPAIRLYRLGQHVVVAIEVIEDGRSRWVEVIRERYDGCFSHIVEPDGIAARVGRKGEG